MKATQQDETKKQPPSWKHFPEISSEHVSIRGGLWIAGCGLRTVYKTAGGPGIKHGLRQRAMI